MKPKNETNWYTDHHCTHAHCPICDDPLIGREHLQPFIDMEGDLVCGTCWYKDKRKIMMQPCGSKGCA